MPFGKRVAKVLVSPLVFIRDDATRTFNGRDARIRRSYVTDVWLDKYGGKSARHFETIYTKEGSIQQDRAIKRGYIKRIGWHGVWVSV